MMSNWVTRFLGIHDKKQAKAAKAATEYAQEKKQEYQHTMDSIQQEVKESQVEVKKSVEKAKKTVRITEDITHKIALVVEKRRLSVR